MNKRRRFKAKSRRAQMVRRWRSSRILQEVLRHEGCPGVVIKPTRYRVRGL